MNHAGSSPSPDDSFPPIGGNESDHRSLQRKHTSEMIGFRHGESNLTPQQTRNLPIQAARADAAVARDSLPFVVQAGPILYLVAEESNAWVVAELRFDPASCTFVEERRARFSWPREAFGRLLSRTSIGDEIDVDEVDRVSDGFSRWLASQFVTHHGVD